MMTELSDVPSYPIRNGRILEDGQLQFPRPSHYQEMVGTSIDRGQLSKDDNVCGQGN